MWEPSGGQNNAIRFSLEKFRLGERKILLGILKLYLETTSYWYIYSILIHFIGYKVLTYFNIFPQPHKVIFYVQNSIFKLYGKILYFYKNVENHRLS